MKMIEYIKKSLLEDKDEIIERILQGDYDEKFDEKDLSRTFEGNIK